MHTVYIPITIGEVIFMKLPDEITESVFSLLSVGRMFIWLIFRSEVVTEEDARIVKSSHGSV